MGLRILREVYKRKTIVKFIFSGGTAAFTDLALLYALTSVFGIWYLISAMIAFVVAFFVSFFLQKFWTFRDGDKKKMYRQMTKYFIVGVFNLGINTIGMYLTVDIFRVFYLFAQVIVSAFVAIESFLIYKHFIFRKEGESSAEEKKGQRILIATGLYPPDFRGPATLLESLPEALRGKGYEVKVLTYSDAKEVEGEAGLVYRINRNRNGFFRRAAYLIKLWRLSDWADLVYATDVYGVGYLVNFVCHIQRKKYLIRFTGDSAWETALLKGETQDYISDFQTKKYGSRTEKLKERRKKIMLGAAKIIVDCRFMADIAKIIGVGADQIKVIYNSLNTDKFKESQARIEEIKKQFGSNSRLIIAIGQLNPWKGFDGIIRVMPRVLERFGPDAKLLILGEGPEKEKLNELAKEKGVSKNVFFLGKIAHSDIINYLKAGDLFILNSNYEGCSHLILEAMHAGSPIIASRSGGNPELIGGEKEGLLVNYNNEEEIFRALCEILGNKEKAGLLALNAKNKSAEYQWERVVGDTICAFKEAL
ncbi:MAG: glycosyltransferase [Patescibacteria group bacterium]|jgi:glycosyltransferase involved in cell wall biosynthesis/putative flippase GtrA